MPSQIRKWLLRQVVAEVLELQVMMVTPMDLMGLVMAAMVYNLVTGLLQHLLAMEDIMLVVDLGAAIILLQ